MSVTATATGPSPEEAFGGGSDPWSATSDRWSTTVSRQLVHRRTVAEVLLTAVAPLGPQEAAIAAQWARTQSFYEPAGGFHDESLVLETLRQAGLALCQQLLGVDATRQFLLHDLQLRLTDPEAMRVGDAPAGVLADCRLSALRFRRDGLRAGRIDAVFHRDGRSFAVASSTFASADPLAYARLRGRRRDQREPGLGGHRPGCAPAAAPGEVGRLRRADVLVCNCMSDFGLRVDPAHGFLFEHPHDHVPGMGLLEACRQAALLHAGAGTSVRIGACAISFAGLAPLDELVRVEVTEAGGGELLVAVLGTSGLLAWSSFRFLPAGGAGGRSRS